MKTICFPSGDHAGARSCAPDVRVKLRVGPFSMGAVKMSPRAVGEKVNRIADPHRVALRALARRDELRSVRLQVVDVEILRPASLVALPRAEVAPERRVDEPLPVGGEIARTRSGHRKSHRG